MEFLTPVWQTVVLVFHIIGVVLSVGTVTVTDYFHLVGLRKRSLERKLLVVYPIFGRIIIWAIGIVLASGIILVANNPLLLQAPLFKLKLGLFIIVLLNGLVLHKHVFPHVVKCVLSEKNSCPTHVLWASSISGTISVVTWYSILILSLTKAFVYSVSSFLTYYFLALVLIFSITYFTEKKYRAWKDS